MSISIVKLFWTAVSLIVLLITLYKFDGKPNSDIEVFLIWSMLVLSFPTGLLYLLLAALLVHSAEILFGFTLATSYISMLVTWSALFVLGYFQWFKLVPFLWEKIKRRKAQT